MAGYSTAFLSNAGTVLPNSAIFEIQTSATDYIRLMSISLSNPAPSSSGSTVVGIGIPAIAGIGKANPIALARHIQGDTGALPGVAIYNEWSRLPTVPTRYFRRMIMTSAGNIPQAVLEFKDGLKLAPSTSLVLWAIAANGVVIMDCNVELDA